MMTLRSFSSLVKIFFITTLISVSVAINEDSAKESPCLKITHAIDPDATWFSSVQKWYYPLASRLDLYRSVHDLLHTDYKNIPEYSMYYDSCLEWGINSDGFTLNGFNGKTRFLKTTTVGPGTSDFQSEWSQGMAGRAYTTLTDNKTFAFTAACFADNQMSWNVFATTETLDEATKQEIFEHAKSLGYNPEYFTEMRYDSCKTKDTTVGTVSSGHSNGAPTAADGLPKPTDESPLGNEVSAPAFSSPGGIPPEQNSELCDACKRLCPNLFTKTAFMNKYYKKLQKYQDVIRRN